MLTQFNRFISEKKLLDPGDKVLLTVSGGIDSVAMFHLFKKSGYSYGVAHCNFKLRGEESEQDELFVEQMAVSSNVPFYRKHFNTMEYAQQHRISVQMAARELRYEWFEEIRRKREYDWIVTAHNQDDVIETFFINLSRGTGIHGLTGIKAKTGRIIRPLLFASRHRIQKYCNQENHTYREDSSNLSVKYTRNKIRHEIIPLLEEINPNFRQSLIETIDRLGDVEAVFNQKVNDIQQEIIHKTDSEVYIDIPKLLREPQRKTYLYELLTAYNFPGQIIKDIEDSLSAIPGKQFISETHRLVKDRDKLIIGPHKEETQRRYYLDDGVNDLKEPVELQLMIVTNSSNFLIPHDQNIACIDYELLDFPLTIRKWQAGDYFQPLGMKHLKKISDFFIDQKLSLVEKENTWILVSGSRIAWVIGRRIDERFKITGKTKQILMIEYKSHH